MLQHLLTAADWSSPFTPQFKLRALRSLKHIFRGLLTKRFVAEPLPQQQQQQGGAAAAAAMGMASITSRLAAERQLYRQQLKECAAPLQKLVAAHLPAFLSPAAAGSSDPAAAAAAAGWQVHGMFGKAAVNGVTELLPLIADPAGLPDGSRQLLELLHQAANQLMAGVPAGMEWKLSLYTNTLMSLHTVVCIHHCIYKLNHVCNSVCM